MKYGLRVSQKSSHKSSLEDDLVKENVKITVEQASPDEKIKTKSFDGPERFDLN